MTGDKRSLLKALRTVAQMPRFPVAKQISESKTVTGLTYTPSGRIVEHSDHGYSH